jgi:hypothetical protein
MNVGIVCMTRCPPDLVRWVEYHIDLGFYRIFLRLEGEKIVPTMKQLERFREVKVLEQEVYPIGAQMPRQEFLVEEAIRVSQEESLDYLLHIDDDELFHVDPSVGLQGMLREMESRTDKEWDYMIFDNVEAVYPHDKASEGRSCFEKTSWFHDCYSSPCRSYGNGKSMTKIDIANPAPFGVHNFRGQSIRVPHTLAMILHFESCNFDAWVLKFRTLKETTNFLYYEKSKEAVQQYDECRGQQCDAILYDFYKRHTHLDSTDTRFQVQLFHKNEH